MQVKDIMTENVPTISAKAPLADAAAAMLESRIGCLVVVERDRACGVLTERDLTARPADNPFEPQRAPRLLGKNVREHGLARIYQDAKAVPVARAMRPAFHSLSEEDAVEKAMDVMVRHGVNHLPVLRRGKPVGLVSRLDLLRLAVA